MHNGQQELNLKRNKEKATVTGTRVGKDEFLDITAEISWAGDRSESWRKKVPNFSACNWFNGFAIMTQPISHKTMTRCLITLRIYPLYGVNNNNINNNSNNDDDNNMEWNGPIAANHRNLILDRSSLSRASFCIYNRRSL